jgi:hypothetical protein
MLTSGYTFTAIGLFGVLAFSSSQCCGANAVADGSVVSTTQSYSADAQKGSFPNGVTAGRPRAAGELEQGVTPAETRDGVVRAKLRQGEVKAKLAEGVTRAVPAVKRSSASVTRAVPAVKRSQPKVTSAVPAVIQAAH